MLSAILLASILYAPGCMPGYELGLDYSCKALDSVIIQSERMSAIEDRIRLKYENVSTLLLDNFAEYMDEADIKLESIDANNETEMLWLEACYEEFLNTD